MINVTLTEFVTVFKIVTLYVSDKNSDICDTF